MTNEKQESWKTVPQWPDYEASSLGRIRRIGSLKTFKPGNTWR